MILAAHYTWLISSPSSTVCPAPPQNGKQKLIVNQKGFCGAMSIFSSLRYCLGSPDDLSHLYIAMTFMPFGLFFDFMDGKVARWRKKSSLMGQELDSLADLVRPPLSAVSHPTVLTRQLDLLRHGPCFMRLRTRFPHLPRHNSPDIFCPLRSLPFGALQRYR